MAFIPTPNGVRHELLYTIAGQLIETVFHANWSAVPITTANLLTFNNDMNAWFASNIAPIMSQDMTYRGIRSTDVTSATGPVVETPPAISVVGGVAEKSLPTNAAIVITKRTVNRGRSYRGRIYMPALPQSDENTATDINTSTLAAIVPAWATLIARAAANGVALAVLSYFNNNAPRAAGVLTSVSSMDGNTAFDSQRRRLAGRGM